MRAAETYQGGNVSKQLDWLWHTGCLVVEDDGRTGSDVNLRHDDAGIGAVICDQTAPSIAWDAKVSCSVSLRFS